MYGTSIVVGVDGQRPRRQRWPDDDDEGVGVVALKCRAHRGGKLRRAGGVAHRPAAAHHQTRGTQSCGGERVEGKGVAHHTDSVTGGQGLSIEHGGDIEELGEMVPTSITPE